MSEDRQPVAVEPRFIVAVFVCFGVGAGLLIAYWINRGGSDVPSWAPYPFFGVQVALVGRIAMRLRREARRGSLRVQYNALSAGEQQIVSTFVAAVVGVLGLIVVQLLL